MTDNKELQDIGEVEDLKGGQIVKTPLVAEMKKAYLDYAMSVIVARALPDVRDGLKPVHRRLIFTAHEMGLTSSSGFSKCAYLVGQVMGRYHPHGDQAIYDSLVRMAQDFSLRYPLIDGQGNFGDIDGSPPAAMRYTECRLEKISDYLLKDIDKNTVDFIDNYSVQFIEPTVLPSVLPNLLMNGSSGIAVGMATNVPPHNLNEIIDAISLVFDKGNVIEDDEKIEIIKAYDLIATEAKVKSWNIEESLSYEDILAVLPGPDFPTGCTIYDKSETLNYFATGKGRIVQRAKANIKEEKNGKSVIEITEIPYQVQKSSLIEKIAGLVNNKKIKEISEIRDVSEGEIISIEIELKRDSRPQKVLNYLYKYSPLQTAFNANMLALVNGQPQVLNIKEMLTEFIKHRRDVVTRRTLHLLKKAREREHILEGLKKALDFIDEVIELIRASQDSDEAKAKLIMRFELTEIQAQAILDMQLRRLAALEREKIENELAEIQKSIGGYLDILGKPAIMIKIIRDELAEVKEKFGDARKTKVIKSKIGEFNEEDLIANEQTLISITESGYIKRLQPGTYRTQSRGGKGVSAMKMKEEDEVAMMRLADTHDQILFLTDKGKIYVTRVWEIPESSRTSKGTALVNIIDTSTEEQIKEVITVDKETQDMAKSIYLLTATKNGQVKKTALSEFDNIRKNGIIAMGLRDNDQLVRALLTTGDWEVILVTAKGKSIRFKAEDARAMGRTASGVKGINLKKDDYVVSMEILPPGGSEEEKEKSLMVITEKGYGKMTNLKDYPRYNRGGAGVKASKVTAKTGDIVGVKLINSNTGDLLVSSENGQVIRMPVESVPTLGRDTQGVILMRLNSGDSVSTLSSIELEEDVAE